MRHTANDDFMTAAQEGRAQECERLLQRGPASQWRSQAGRALLSIALVAASKRGDADVVRVLLTRGANVNVVQLRFPKEQSSYQVPDGECPLHAAATRGHTEVVQALLAGGADANLQAHGHPSPLHGAAKAGHLDTLLALLAGGATLDLASEVAGTHGATPLCSAAECGQAQATRLLLVQGANPNPPLKGHATPLLLATRHNDVHSMMMLLAGGAHVDATTQGGHTALCLAARHGHAAAVRALLAGEASVNRPDQEGRHPLMLAAHAGHTGAVNALLAGGADVDARGPPDGTTPLWCAVIGNHLNTIKALLASGATVDHAGESGLTPLATAVTRRRAEATRLLPAAGAKPELAIQIIACESDRHTIRTFILEQQSGG